MLLEEIKVYYWRITITCISKDKGDNCNRYTGHNLSLETKNAVV